MKVELQIDGSQMGETIQQVFNNLTKEQQLELARNTMLEWLKSPIDFERQLYERQALEEVKKSRSGGFYNNNSDAEIMNGYEFREKMRTFKSTKEKMIAEITEATIRHYKETVSELVAKDEQIQAMLAVVKEELKNAFPKMVQDAMMIWFASKMDSIATALIDENHSRGIAYFSENLSSRLANMKYLPQTK
jgi:hypothetical protein